MIRKVVDNNGSLRLTIPQSIVDLYELSPNDKVKWGISTENGALTLQFIKEDK